MPIDLTAMVIAALPAPDGGIEPPNLPAPAGTTYIWMHTTVRGIPDQKALNGRLGTDWAFVAPAVHPTATAMTLGAAIEGRAFCLMQKDTVLVAEQGALERIHHMDLDMRTLAVRKRYTGAAQRVTLAGVEMDVSITARRKDGTVLKPLTTLDEVRAELAHYGFPAADIRLFMQRHFGA